MNTETLQGRALADRYRIGNRLGAGGMADVYDGLDLRLARPVAIKVLRREMAANPDVRRRFEAEARSAARLSHPNVVGVFDTGEDDGIPFIVMERLPGETLADRMARGPVDQPWLARVAGDVLLALGAAHSAGLVHRDVKPGNILISPEGCAKVADFGIAKSTEPLAAGQEETATNILVGTPAYLAPERLDGGAATPRTDLYAVGVVLYEALAGRKPFAGPTPLAVAHLVRDGRFPPLQELRPDADPALVEAVERAMARQPADRFASAEEMRAVIERRPAHTAVMPRPAAASPAAGGAAAAIVEGQATTVMSTDRTLVAPVPGPATPPPAAGTPGPAPVPPFLDDRSGPARRSGRRLAPVAVAGLAAGVLLVLLAAILLAQHHGAAGAGTDQNHQLAVHMRSAADRVRTGDGPRGPEVADRLEKIATSLDAGTPVRDPSTRLLQDVTTWAQSGELSQPAAALVSPLLVDAGAVPPEPTTAAPDTTALEPPTTTAPGPAPAPAPRRGKRHKGD